MSHKRNRSDDDVKTLSSKKSVSDMLKSLQKTATGSRNIDSHKGNDEGRQMGDSRLGLNNKQLKDDSEVETDDDKTISEFEDFSDEEEAKEEEIDVTLPAIDIQHASPKDLQKDENLRVDTSDQPTDNLPTGHWILSSPFAAAALAVAAPSSSANNYDNDTHDAFAGADSGTGGPGIIKPLCHGQGDSVHIVDDVVLYKDDNYKRPRVGKRQSCEAKLEIAATGEIGVMLMARIKVVDGGKDEYSLLRHAWVRKGRCLGRMVRELLKSRVVMVEVYWHRRYYWRKWETAGFDGDIFWKSFPNMDSAMTVEHVEFRDLEEDSD